MLSLHVFSAVAVLLCFEGALSLRIFKEFSPSCLVETSEGFLDLRGVARYGGYHTAFSTPKDEGDVRTHFNPCQDTTIPWLKCNSRGQIFQTSNKMAGCETLASGKDSSFSVRNDKLILNYRDYKTGADIHISFNCSQYDPIEELMEDDYCWDTNGYCYTLTHTDSCLRPVDVTDVIASASNKLGASLVFVGLVLLTYLHLH